VGNLCRFWDEGVGPLGDAWEQIKGWLANKLGEGAYQNWISKTAQGSLRDGELTVRVPNETTEAWIRQEYGAQVRAAISELNLPIRKISYEIAFAAPANGQTAFSSSPFGQPLPAHQQGPPHQMGQRPVAADLQFEETAAWLNPRLTFDT
jgi:chromosomal replication initiation ATPase DnaA